MPGAGAQLEPDPAAEAQAEGNVEGREQEAFAHADLAILLVQDAEIENQKHDDDGEKGQPHPDRLGHPGGEQKSGHKFH